MDNKATPYKVAFDNWNVEVIDSEPPEKIARIGSDITERTNPDDEENHDPNNAETNLPIECMDIVDEFGTKITSNNNLVKPATAFSSNSALIDAQRKSKSNESVLDVSNSKESEAPNVFDSRKIPFLLSGKYFEIQDRSNGMTKACCTTCKSVYSASYNVTSNFLTHLKVYICSILSLFFSIQNIFNAIKINSWFAFSFTETSRSVSAVSK